MPLPIIQPLPQQNCAECPRQPRCYDSKASSDAVNLNILVCRLKMGLERDRTAKLILEHIRPALLKYTGQICRRLRKQRLDPREVIADLQSYAIEMLDRRYDFWREGSAYPAKYLFDTGHGCIYWRSANYGELTRKQYPENEAIFRADSRAEQLEERVEMDWEGMEERLKRVLAKLSDEEYQVACLRLEGETYVNAAKILGLDSKTCKGVWERAQAKIKTELRLA